MPYKFRTIKEDEKMCGTCQFWVKEQAYNYRERAYYLNFSCECIVPIHIPEDMPSSVQRGSTCFEDGANCPLFKKSEQGPFDVILKYVEEV